MSTFEVTVIECDGGDDCASRFVGRPGMRLWQVLEYAERDGWIRILGEPPNLDLCADCVKEGRGR